MQGDGAYLDKLTQNHAFSRETGFNHLNFGMEINFLSFLFLVAHDKKIKPNESP